MNVINSTMKTIRVDGSPPVGDGFLWLMMSFQVSPH